MLSYMHLHKCFPKVMNASVKKSCYFIFRVFNNLPLQSFLLTIFLTCATPLLEKEDVSRFNQSVSGKTFLVRKDIYPQFSQRDSDRKPIFKKGDILRLTLEQGAEWLRVRAFLAKEQQEQSQGKVILFIITNFLPEERSKNYSLDQLQHSLTKLLKELPNPTR